MSSEGKKPAFDGEMSNVYAKIAQNHRQADGPWPKMVEKISRTLKQKVKGLNLSAGAKVLDLASGMGEPAITIAEACPDLTVVVMKIGMTNVTFEIAEIRAELMNAHAQTQGTDVSPDMVAKANGSIEKGGLKNCSAEVVDMQDLSKFGDETFDCVTVCYGYMFPEDKNKSLQETLRVLKPGGTLIATTWNALQLLKLTRAVMTAVLGEAPPPPPVNPMSLAEEGLFEKMCTDAGFDKDSLQVETSTYAFDMGTEKTFQYKVGTILVADKIKAMGKEEVAEKAFWDNVPDVAKVGDDGSMSMGGNTFKLTCVRKAA